MNQRLKMKNDDLRKELIKLFDLENTNQRHPKSDKLWCKQYDKIKKLVEYEPEVK